MENESKKWELLYKRVAETSVMEDCMNLELEVQDIPDPEYSDEFLSSMNSIVESLNKKGKKQQIKVKVRKHILAFVAVISTILVLAVSVGAVGGKFSFLFTSSEPTHTDVFFRNQWDIPKGWAYVYYITELPEGYQAVDRIDSDNSIITIYGVPNDNQRATLNLEQYKTAPDFLSLDTEKMDSEKVEINGTPAVCFSSENKRILIWNLNEDYLMSTEQKKGHVISRNSAVSAV